MPGSLPIFPPRHALSFISGRWTTPLQVSFSSPSRSFFHFGEMDCPAPCQFSLPFSLFLSFWGDGRPGSLAIFPPLPSPSFNSGRLSRETCPENKPCCNKSKKIPTEETSLRRRLKNSNRKIQIDIRLNNQFCRVNYLLIASAIATATATEAPTIGLLPIPMRPIISTCAGTDEEPAN